MTNKLNANIFHGGLIVLIFAAILWLLLTSGCTTTDKETGLIEYTPDTIGYTETVSGIVEAAAPAIPQPYGAVVGFLPEIVAAGMAVWLGILNHKKSGIITSIVEGVEKGNDSKTKLSIADMSAFNGNSESVHKQVKKITT